MHGLDCWKMHVFLTRPCWLPCKPSRLPLMYAQQLWIIYLFMSQDAGPWMDMSSRSYLIILGNVWRTLRQFGVGLPESLELDLHMLVEKMANTQIWGRNKEEVEMWVKLLWKWVVKKYQENYLRGGEAEKAMWPLQRKRKLWINAEKTNGKVVRLTMNNRAAKKGNCVLPFLRKPFLLATNHPNQRLESY